jgi:hypothetical protein
MQLNVAPDTYIAGYTVAETASVKGSEGLDGFVATATGRSFHEGMFALGDTAAEAVTSLGAVIGEALRGAAGAKRGFEQGRFTRVMLVAATVVDIDVVS